MAQPCLHNRCDVGGDRRRRSLLLLVLLGAIGSSSALFGRRRGGRYRGGVPRPDMRRYDPAYKAYRQKVYGEAATTFRPYAREDEDQETADYDYGENQQQGQQDGDTTGATSRSKIRRDAMKKQQKRELAVLEKAGMRPYKLQPPPAFGRSSLSNKIVMTNVAMYALQVWKPELTRRFAKRSDLILQGKELYRLITPVFLHGGVVHLMMNSYSLQNIGPQIEETFGSGRFLATYLASGIAGNLLSSYMSPNPAVGASGAIFGLMGAHYAFLSENNLGAYSQRGIAAVTETVAVNLVFGFLNPMIDNWGHGGGLIGGAAMAAAIGPRLRMLNFPDGRPPMVVDQPRFRLPKVYEELGRKIGAMFNAPAKLPGQTIPIQSDLGGNPWGASSSSRSFRTSTPTREMLKPRARWTRPVHVLPQ